MLPETRLQCIKRIGSSIARPLLKNSVILWYYLYLVYIFHGRLCDNFVYDFMYGFWGIVGEYMLRRICLRCKWKSSNFCTDNRETDRDKSVRRLCGDCTTIMQFKCSHRSVYASFQRKSYRVRAASVQRRYDFFWQQVYVCCTIIARTPNDARAGIEISAKICLRANGLQFLKFV